MKESIVKTKSFDFAVRIVNLNKFLKKRERDLEINKQLVRSGTSIAANVCEANDAQSNADFIHKLSIAQKECSETKFWLQLLYKTEYLTEKQFQSIFDDCNQLYKIITSIIITKKNNLKNL